MRPVGVFTGLSTLDVIYRVSGPPPHDGKAVASAQELAAGGPATNAAVTFAALTAAVDRAGGAARAGSAHAGADAAPGAATLVTALGRHPLARLCAAELRSRGVAVLDATPDRPEPPAVSSAYVVESTGARSVVSVNAAGIDASAPPSLASTVAAGTVLLIDGHHPKLALSAATAAREAGRLVLLDGGSWKPGLDSLLPLVDVAACSADFRVPGAGSAADSAAVLRTRYGVPVVAVTAGAEPVRWWYDQAAGAVSSAAGAVSPAAAAVSPAPADAHADGTSAALAAGEIAVPVTVARDTLGAGDAFHGALAWALAVRPHCARSAVGIAAALGVAARVAAIRCATAGARAWLADPRLADLACDWAGGE
jgi:sugar/nucleoside kinase (ribokinase family)